MALRKYIATLTINIMHVCVYFFSHYSLPELPHLNVFKLLQHKTNEHLQHTMQHMFVEFY